MNRYTWTDWLLVAAAIAAVAFTLSLRAKMDDRTAPGTVSRTVPLDTVPCGHLERCTPLVRVRWMSDNPLAGWR
jgi:hypothetical protein